MSTRALSPSPRSSRADRRRYLYEPGASRPPRRSYPVEVLTPAEVAALLNACGDGCGDGDARALRNRALIAVLYRAGLRIAEALALRPVDVDLAQGAIRVLHGKGDRARLSGLDAGAARVVAAWLEARGRWGAEAAGTARLGGGSDGGPLFCTQRGDAVTAGYVRRLLPALARRAGIAKRVHAHGLRHTHASELRAEGVDIGIISKQLGHASITTTARYLDHLNPLAVVEAMRGRRWG